LRTDLLKLSQSLELIVVAYLAVLAARAATVYPILTIFDKVSKNVDNKIPLKWRNVAMIGGMRGALSIALSASIVSSVAISASDAVTISDMVLGVAFTSIIVQGALLSTYAKRRFPEQKEAKEKTAARFASIASEIESLQKLKNDGKVTDEIFAVEIEGYIDSLTEILSELETSIGPGSILRARAFRLYDSISSTLPSSKEPQVQAPENHPESASDAKKKSNPEDKENRSLG
jgi:NhaP-type Na+/H+ or K+/H+ antiporter